MADPTSVEEQLRQRRLPIVYVRGYAGGTGGIDKQVDDPFYGFNAGSTHVRVGREGKPLFYQFESPLLRLMDDEGYELLVYGDQHAYLSSRPDGKVEPSTIWVYRFYDASASTWARPPVDFNIQKAAEGLYEYVTLVLQKTGAPRVHLVAHSMGGLICRSMLQQVCLTPIQNADKTETPRQPGSDLVDKLFTYGTPHGGITFAAGGGLIDWAVETFGPAGSDIFSPRKMYGYLTPGAKWGDQGPEGWSSQEMPTEALPAERIFSLIGTDAKDYGVVEKVVGPKSDGLVAIENAYVKNAHRAFVHRAHSGRYGLVNSEEGYQNLRRFLFGFFKVKIELAGLHLPLLVAGESWQADVRVSVRGLPIVMHEQTAEHHCPVQLLLKEKKGQDDADAPIPLATVFLLAPEAMRRDGSYELRPRCRYSLQLRVARLVERDGFFWWQDHLEQTADWDDTLIVDVGRLEADPPGTLHGWAEWNSAIEGPIATHDPISETKLPFFEKVTDIAFPQRARAILGEQSTVRFSLSEWPPKPLG